MERKGWTFHKCTYTHTALRACTMLRLIHSLTEVEDTVCVCVGEREREREIEREQESKSFSMKIIAC